MLSGPARVAALRATGMLDSPSEERFDRLTRLAARLLGAPVALLSLVDEDRQFFKSQFGLPEPARSARQTPLSHSFCQFAVANGSPLVVADARVHPTLRHNMAIDDLGVVAYCGIPLTAGEGHAIGSFCVIDSRPRSWTDDDVATMRDLADTVTAEIDLRQALRDARAGAVPVDVRAVSHDLRLPLTAILGAARTLRERPTLTDAERSTLTDVVIRQGDRLAAMLDDLLASTSPGPAHRRPGSLDLADLSRRVATDFRAAASGRLDVQAPAPVLVAADPGATERVLLNLVDNAVRHAHGGRVRVDVRARDRGGEVAVTNGGPPIPSEMLPYVFDAGRRRPGSTGHGLGLHITRDLVRVQGGEIRVSSDAEHGTTFTVWFPAPV